MKTARNLLFVSLCSAGVAFAETTVPVHDDLATAAANLKPGGVHYSLTNVEGDAEGLVAFLLGLVPEEQVQHQPASLLVKNAPELLKRAGFLATTAKGSSSTALGENAWHNRLFFGHKGRSGVFTLLGDAPKDWQAAAFASPDADLVLELQLNTTQVIKTLENVLELFPAEAKAEIDAEVWDQLDQPLFPNAPMTIRQLIEAANVRGSIALTLDPDTKWQPQPGAPELPGFDVIARLDGVEPLMPLYEATIAAMLPKKDVEGLAVHAAPQMPAPFGVIQPTVVMDASNGELWLRLKGSPLDVLPAKGKALADSETFKKAVTDFPEKGSAFAYLSDEALGLIQGLIKQAPDVDAEAGAMIDKIAAEVRETGFGLSAAISSKEEGFLLTANLPMAVKDGGGLGSLGTIVTLSSLATPAILQARMKAEALEEATEAE